MIDIHNHILPGIDDGCKTMDEAISALKQASSLGIESIVLTPHYVKGSKYDCNNKDKKKIFNSLKKEVKNNNIDVNLYLGNEVYFENDMLSLIEAGEATTINNSRYLLFELPMTSEVNNLKDVIFSLRVKGVIPVIAHPERYTVFQDKPNEMVDLINQGCLFQGNLGSLVGIYGKEANKCINVLLKHNLIHFMASDTHHANGKNYGLLLEAKKELIDIVGLEYANELLRDNAKKMIDDENIEVREAKSVKKKLFFF